MSSVQYVRSTLTTATAAVNMGWREARVTQGALPPLQLIADIMRKVDVDVIQAR